MKVHGKDQSKMKIVINRKYLFLIVLLTSQYQNSESQNCPTNLANSVVYEGNQTSFSRVNVGLAVKWQVAPSSSTFNTLQDINPYYNNSVDPQFLTTYAVNSTQLIIFKSTTAPQGTMPYSTAGIYILNYQNSGCMTGAGLTVIKSGPVCSCDASDPNYITLSCSVEYANYDKQQINPIMTWTSSSGSIAYQETPDRMSLDSSNQGLQSSTSLLRIVSNETQTYRCQLTFSAPMSSQPSFIDPNAPNFTASCFISNCAILKTATTTTTKPILIKSTTAAENNCFGQKLANAVVYEGNQTSFSRANDGQPTKWQVAPSSFGSGSLQDINPNYTNTVSPQFLTTYAVNSTHLIIFNSTVASQGSMPYSTSGIYILNYENSSCMTGAGLTVIKSGPVCSCNASHPKYVTLYCKVEYANYIQQQINPIMTWTNVNDSVVFQETPARSSLYSNNYGLQNSTSRFLIAATDAQIYKCQLTFSAPTEIQPSYIDPNAPNFTASCFISNCAILTTAAASTTKPILGQSTSSSKMASTTAAGNICFGNKLANTVVYEGNRTSISRVKNGLAVQWQVAPSSSNFGYSLRNITPNYDDNVAAQFNTTYAVNSTQLLIFNSTVAPQGSMPFSTAGIYILNYQNSSCMTGAGLTVIKRGPLCSCKASDPINVTLSCSVEYANYINQQINPIMTWTNNGGAIVFQDNPPRNGLDSSNPGLQSSTSLLRIVRNETQTYRCQLTFSTPTSIQPSFIDPNAPNFTATCFISNCALLTTETASTTKPILGQSTSSSKMASTTAAGNICFGNKLANTVVYEGNRTSISRAKDGLAVQWQVAPSSSNFGYSLRNITPNYDNNVDAQFNTTYAVNSTQLLIFNSTVAPQGSMPYSTAGIYILNYQNSSCMTGAGLTVIKKVPLCSCDASDPNYVTLSCSVEYANYVRQQINPIMTWTNNRGAIVFQDNPPRQVPDYSNPGLQSSTSLLRIVRNETQTYGCQLTFSTPTEIQPSFIDSNAPNFTASCFISNCAILTTIV